MTYEDIKNDLAKIFKGEIVNDEATLATNSKDASFSWSSRNSSSILKTVPT